jgi:hypothetical protein
MTVAKWGSFHPYYVVEAVVFSVVGWTIFIFFILQFLAEKKHIDMVGKVHRVFHVCGIIMGGELVFTAIDPQGVFGIIRWDVLVLAKDVGATAVGYIPLTLWTLTLITILGEQHGLNGFELSRHMERYGGMYCSVLSTLNFIIVLVTDTVAIRANSTFARGFQILYLSVSFFAAVVMLVYTYAKLLVLKGQTQTSARLHSNGGKCSSYFSPETRKIRYAALVFLFASLMQLQGAISILLQPAQLSADQVPRDPTKIQVFYWILPYWSGMLICLMGSWLPLDHLACWKISKSRTRGAEAGVSVDGRNNRPVSRTTSQAQVQNSHH